MNAYFWGKRRCKNDIGEDNKRAWLFGGIAAKLSLKTSSLGELAKKKKSRQNGNNHGLKK